MRSLMFSSVALAMLVMVSITGADVQKSREESDSRDVISPIKMSKTHRGGRAVNAHRYRSPGPVRKVVIPADNAEALALAKSRGAIEISDYDSFKLLAMDQSALEALEDAKQRNVSAADSASSPFRLQNSAPSVIVRDDYNVLLLRSGAIDTIDEESPGNLLGMGRATSLLNRPDIQSRRDSFAGDGLRLIQFTGPVKRAWLKQLEANGFEIISYVPNNGYLVRGNPGSEKALFALKTEGEEIVQWEGPFANEYKIHPGLAVAMSERADKEVTVAVQLARSRFDKDAGPLLDAKAVKEMASSIIGDQYNVSGFINIKIKVRASRIARIAALPNVVNVEPWSAPELFDERANQAVAGNLTEDGKKASGPGYLEWLQSRGLASKFDFAIDIADTGIDRGEITAEKLHPDFLDGAGQSRIVYARDYTGEFDSGDVRGHGTINISIAGGSNFSTDKAARDSLNFGHGIGVAPFALLGSSKIFQSNGSFNLAEPYTNLVSAAYQDGVRILSNSWGAGGNDYTIDSQEYDLRVRDALPKEPGNQELVVCFAAGNAGGGGAIVSPGTGKNVISVAASENARDGGSDGCSVNDSDADNVLDIAFFSSGGPLDDGRIKPDIAAPGTHVQGAASQHPEFNGASVCGETASKPYFPKDQTLYTWSSGTSHSTPVVAGAAALVRQFFLNRGMDPSAAFVKAIMLNSTRYMNGELAGGNLPQERQGWGLLDLGRAFDDTPRIMVNQDHTFNDSGQEWVVTGEIAHSDRPFRVTLAWTDAPGFSAFAPWVNDLDLEVIINGQVYGGNNFINDQSQPGGEPDTKNNVEGVWLPAGVTGTFVIRVRATSLAGDAVPGNINFTDQDFALVAYNAVKKDVAVPTLVGVSITGGADNIVDPGETVSIKIGLKGSSSIKLVGAQGNLTTSTAGVTVTSAISNFPDIAPGDTGENAQPFSFTVAPNFKCGDEIEFALDLIYQGSLSRVPFRALVGRAVLTEFFEDDIETGETKWTHGSGIKKKKKRTDTWEISTKLFRSGKSSWFTPNPAKFTDAHLDTIPIALPAEGRNLQLVFFHTFSFEGGGFDGGALEISTGKEFEDLGPKILKGGYNGSILSFSGSPLAGRRGWIEGRLGQFQQVVVDLSSYAGQTVIIRFKVGTDSSISAPGWYVDDVAIKGDRAICAPTN